MAQPDEPIAFAGHLEELRRRLIYTAVFFFIAFSAVFAWGATPIINFIQGIAVVHREVHGKIEDVQIQFSLIGTMEGFSTAMRVSLYAAMVATYPFGMLQAWLFVAPGLYRKERQFFLFAIPAIFVLFFAGAAFGRYVLLPISIPFLLEFNVDELNVKQLFSLREFLDLVFALTFGLGFIFQLPLLVAPLVRFGLLKPDFFKRKRRYTLLGSVVIGAVISPSGSPIDMIIAGAPVFFLVEGGVWLGRAWRALALRRAEKAALAAQARGEKVDAEALAGGLAFDLEEKLRGLAAGDARKLARDLLTGFKQGMREAGGGNDFNPRALFDDDYKDDERPPSEVKLRTQPRRKREPAPATMPSAPVGESIPAVSPVMPAQSEPPAEPAAAVPAVKDPFDAQFPDRPWDENVPEDMARYIDDRISCRLDDMFERRVKPFLERALRELKNNGHAKEQPQPETKEQP